MTAGSVAGRLAALGLELPEVPAPLAAYVPAARAGEWVYTAGQLPLRAGVPLATGAVGLDVDPQTAEACARQCALNALAAVATVADLERVQVVKVTGFVASAPGFTGQPAVVNGASGLLVDVLGEHGRHARSAVGVAALPLGVPVEVELIARELP